MQKPLLRVRFTEKSKQVVVTVTKYYHLQENQCLDIFLPKEYSYQIVDETEPADVCIVGCLHSDNSLLRENEMNVLLLIENLSCPERTWYIHFNTFGRVNPMIDLYIYNDVSNKTHNTIPTVFKRIEYFQSIEKSMLNLPSLCTPFSKKYFCLFVSKNAMNGNKLIILNKLSKLGEIHMISIYDHILQDKSCYNSPQMLEIFNKYKFIISFENSRTDGYITEKIFNVFLSRSIPIYDGAPNINTFINKKSFIQYDEDTFHKIQMIMNNEVIYNSILNQPKIVESDYSSIDVFNNCLKKKIDINAVKLQNYSSMVYKKMETQALRKNKTFICGSVRNCGPYLNKVFENIEKVASVFDDYHIIMSVDDSKDNTVEILIEKQKQHTKEKMDILINTNTLSNIRVENICNARNKYLVRMIEINNLLDDTEKINYFIVLDCDDVCSYSMNETVLKPYLNRTDWDALSFNRNQYYDFWALSIEPYVYSCWHWNDARKVIDDMRNYLKTRISELKEGELLPCHSAFDGFAIYRLDKFIDCKYNWNIDIKIFSKEQIEQNIARIGSLPFTNNMFGDCEHRRFHLEAIHKNNAQIRISPLSIFHDV